MTMLFTKMADVNTKMFVGVHIATNGRAFFDLETAALTRSAVAAKNFPLNQIVKVKLVEIEG